MTHNLLHWYKLSHLRGNLIYETAKSKHKVIQLNKDKYEDIMKDLRLLTKEDVKFNIVTSSAETSWDVVVKGWMQSCQF